jgi:hypothetical protein
MALSMLGEAQSFDSGSTGVDGALVLTTPGPVDFGSTAFRPRLNSATGNIYHFTSIYVAKDVVVKLSAKVLRNPVFWLSQGPIVIDGTIDLDGADGDVTPSVPGAGGYPGGGVRQAGYKPDHAFRQNMFLVPLVGGSGGDGGETRGGGAGGGALLLASSASITVNGTITARGGASLDGVGGGGGSIRLAAPLIVGSSGVLTATGGQPRGVDGRIRFEAFDNRFTGSLGDTPFSQGKPFGLFLPPNPPSQVRVVSVGGIAVPGSEFTFTLPSPVLTVIEARFIPPGTVIQLDFFPERGPSYTVQTTPLDGTFELSHAVAFVTFPSGLTHSLAKAAWTQPARFGNDREPRK